MLIFQKLILNHKTMIFKIIMNKAVYTASSVACFWAGAVTLLIASSAETALKQSFCADSARFRTSGTDRPTDRRSDRQ